MPAGIEARHRKGCRATPCTCKPSYRAVVYDKDTGKRITKTFPTLAVAKTWHRDTYAALARGMTVAARTEMTLGDAMEQWLRDADSGKVKKRDRTPFAPSSIASIRQNWNLRLKDEFQGVRLSRVTLLDLQDYVDELDAEGVHPGTIEATVLPLRLVYRRAKTRGLVTVDPTDGLELPAKPVGARKPPPPGHALKLVDALPDTDRGLWATAMFTGLRRGELLALRWQDVNLDGGTLRVERSWNPCHGYGKPKSAKGVRSVPVGRRLVPILREHMLRTGRRDGLLFTTNGDTPPQPSAVQARADAAWKARGLDRVTLHACRHLYASMCIAAGVNAHALSKYMGHASIATTFDLYGHMFPGNEAEAAGLLDSYLDAAAG